MGNEYIKGIAKLSNSIIISTYIPQVDTDIFHYTSPGGLNSILINQTLRFTDRNYLNDYSEGRHVLELCISEANTLVANHEKFRTEFIKRCEERLANPQRANFYVYQCSFSLDEDNLCLWNYYTKGDSIKGYNLKFNSGELCKLIKPTSALEDGRCPKLISGRVVYKKDEQIRIVNEIIDAFFAFSEKYDDHIHYKFTMGLLVDKLMFAGIFFKKECFAIENEYRIAFDLYLDENGKYAAIMEKQSFYEKNGSFIPYVDIPFSPEALRGVSISPTLDLENTRKSLLRITQKDFKGIDGIDKITKSNIPVRY